MRTLLLSVAFLSSVFFISFYNASEAKNTASELKSEQELLEQNKPTQVCDAQLIFVNVPKVKQQTLSLNKKVSLGLSQFLSIQHSRFGVKVATNVICQKLTGSQYTGSELEWTQFIQQGVSGLKSSGGKKLRLEIVGEKDKVFKQSLDNREYNFFGEFKGSMQEIHNVAILDKPNNTVYTLSVSGNDKGVIAIKEEFIRLINTFKLNVKDR